MKSGSVRSAATEKTCTRESLLVVDFGSVGDPPKKLDDGGKIVSAVEEIFEFREIARHMLFAHGSICSNQSGLYVAEDDVDPFEGGRLCGFRATASLDDGVGTPGFGDSEETSQSIGSDVGSGRQRRTGEFADGEFTERLDAPQDDLIGLAVLGRGDGRNKRRPAACAAPRRPG